jgi:hypothetical protein
VCLIELIIIKLSRLVKKWILVGKDVIYFIIKIKNQPKTSHGEEIMSIINLTFVVWLNNLKYSER